MSGQSAPRPGSANYTYLMHLETMNFDNQTCVLLQANGQFHLEEERGDRTKVFEGTLSEAKLLETQNIINNDGLRSLTQKQITLLKGNILLDELRIDIFRGDHWQVLFFPDNTTRKPFESAVAPIVTWLATLRKEPHQELTEDEGKNDCRFPKRIVLKRRRSPPASSTPQP
jgi:hypothetical protein